MFSGDARPLRRPETLRRTRSTILSTQQDRTGSSPAPDGGGGLPTGVNPPYVITRVPEKGQSEDLFWRVDTGVTTLRLGVRAFLGEDPPRLGRVVRALLVNPTTYEKGLKDTPRLEAFFLTLNPVQPGP